MLVDKTMEEYNLGSLEYISSSEVHPMTPLMFLNTIPGPIEDKTVNYTETFLA